MKRVLAMGFLGFATTLALGCEPGGGSDTTSGGKTDAGGTTGTTTDTGGTTGTTTGGDNSFGAVELDDDPNNSTLQDCKGSPGADIDSLKLMDSKSTLISWAKTCKYVQPKAGAGCDANTHANASDAQGETNNSCVGEEDNVYVSLNGGSLFCDFGTAQITKGQGQLLEITEVGPNSTGTSTCDKGVKENYSLSLCKNIDGNCQFKQAQGSGVSTVQLDNMF